MRPGAFRGSRLPFPRPIRGSPAQVYMTVLFRRRTREARDGGVLVLEDFEDRQELGHGEGVVDAPRGVQELELAAESLNGAVARHQLAHAGAVHEGYLPEVDEDSVPSRGEESVDRLTELVVAAAAGELSREDENRDTVFLTKVELHRNDSPQPVMARIACQSTRTS